MRAATKPPLHQPPSTAGALSSPVSTSSVMANNRRFIVVVECLKKHFSGEGRLQTPHLMFFIFSLARSVDFAITINNIPSVASALPSLIKEVYCCKNESSLQSAIMVLLIASKSACGAGWFGSADAAEVINMANEFSGSFCLNAKIVSEAENVTNIVSKLFSRFYPRLKLCSLITSFEAKVGYDILMSDFHISRSKPPSAEGIWLVVAPGDNLETLSCLISPPHVNFLINGKGVEKRMIASMENRPQYPTHITKLLKYGTNIIQAIGYFSSNYFIAIAYMSEVVLSPTMLKDYDRSIAGEVTADSDITEGPSRVSLNCPISHTRINNPVKGYLCKHYQCFDFDNFMQMNSRKPTWHCPCCNQPVCFTDLRIDQSMKKVIREVGQAIADVLISSDGSWMVLNEQNQAIAHLHQKTCEAVQVAHEKNESDAISNMQTNLIDLSMEIDGGNGDDSHKAEDAMPYNKDGFIPSDLIDGTVFAASDSFANHRQTDGDIWARSFSPTTSYGLSAPIIRQGSHMAGTRGPSVPLSLIKPVTADATTVVTESNSDPTAYFRNCKASLSPQQTSQIHKCSELVQLQQSLFENTAILAGNVRKPIPKQVDRIPNAVQALPVQASCSSQRAQLMKSSSLDPACSSTSYQPITPGRTIQLGQNPGNWNTGFQRSLNSPTDSSFRQNPLTQNPPLPVPRPIRSSSLQQLGHEVQDMNPTNTGIPSMHHRGSGNSKIHTQFLSNIQTPGTTYSRVAFPSMSNSSHMPSTKVSQPPTKSISPKVSQPPTKSSSSVDAVVDSQIQQSAQQIAFPSRLQPGITALQTNMSGASLPDHPSDQSWRPTGRMRGSLTGDAYSAALSQYLNVPPPVVAPPLIPPENLSALIANDILAHGHVSLPANMSKGNCSQRRDANTL